MWMALQETEPGNAIDLVVKTQLALGRRLFHKAV